jgi:hypothetical protein
METHWWLVAASAPSWPQPTRATPGRQTTSLAEPRRQPPHRRMEAGWW